MGNLKDLSVKIDLNNLSSDQKKKLTELRMSNDGQKTDETRWETNGVNGAKKFVENRKSVITKYLSTK